MRQRTILAVLRIVDRTRDRAARSAALSLVFKVAGSPHGMTTSDLFAVLALARGIK